MLTRYAQTIIRFRWLVILTTLIAVALAARGMQSLAFTNDYRAFFAAENPQLQAFEKLQNTYDKSDNVMFIVTPEAGTVFTPETLDSLAWLTEQAWQTPYSTRVDSITNFQYSSADGDDLLVRDLVEEPLHLSASELAEIEAVAQAEPQLARRLLSADSRVAGVNVIVQLPGKSLTEVPEVAAFARDLAEQLRQRDPSLNVQLGGIAMMNAAFAESAQQDSATLVPLMFAVVILTLALLLHSWRGVLITAAAFALPAALFALVFYQVVAVGYWLVLLGAAISVILLGKYLSAAFSSVLVMICSILVAMGAFGWAGFQLTSMSISAPTIILTMAVADCVHLLVSFFWGMRHGKSKHDAMVESLRINMLPVFITSLTTVLGFLSMNFSEVPPIAHLGNIVAIGVAAAFVLSVSFLPALMMVLPLRVTPVREGDRPRWTDSFAEMVIRGRKLLLWGSLAVSALLMVFIPRNEINDEFVKYFDESMPFRVATDYGAEHLVGPYTIEYSLKAWADENGESAITDPEFLATVERFANYLKSFEQVDHVYTLTDMFKRLNRNMHGDDPAQYKLPASRELAAQYLLLYEISLPYGLDLNNQIDVGKSATRLTVSMQNMSTNEVLSLEKTWANWLKTNAPQIEYSAASTTLMFAHIGYRNAHSLVQGTILALIAISLILVLALRSLKVGLLSLVPNLVPAGIAFGIWGLIDGQVGMSVSVVAGMTLGIVVDDTVHFLSKYLHARRDKGLDSFDATRYAFSHVGQALLVTSVVLVAGFMVLTLSTFKMNADMGLLTALTISVALVVDFLLLPPLLMWMESRRAKKPLNLDAPGCVEVSTHTEKF